MGIVLGGFFQVFTTGLNAHETAGDRLVLVDRAHWTLDRISRVLGESDDIKTPAAIGDTASDIEISERFTDTYNNATLVYTPEGDGLPDADNDGDSLVNEDAVTPDPKEYVRFFLDGMKLYEQPVDYATATLHDKKADLLLCDNVSRFEAIKISDKLMEIYLTVQSGPDEVALFTRIRARNVE